MTLTASVGIVGIFLVDLIDMYFLSLLGQAELAAAVGYAGSITLFTTSICIGLAIATGVIQANMLGEGHADQAKQAFMGSLFTTFLVALLVTLILYPNLEIALIALGAQGQTLAYALEFLQIVVPTLPCLALGMSLSFTLRSLGAAKNAMYTTLIGSLVNGILDPIFIFGLDMDIKGAALASALARIAMMLFAALILVKQYEYFSTPGQRVFMRNSWQTLKLSLPAVLTNFATPAANAYIVYAISKYGESAVAGYAIIGRLLPVAFAIIFALSGAIGPIVGQNYGAKLFPRITRTINFAYLFTCAYVVTVWLLLLLIADWLVVAFDASGEAKALLLLFCNLLCLSFLFSGFTFVGNAVFNNIKKPHYSTIMNWSKATVGTIPFVLIGAYFYDAQGILIGQALGNIVFGIITYFAVVKVLRISNQL